MYVIIVLHMHTCAPTPGVVDSSGIEFVYTDTPPVHKAGVLTVGHNVDSSHVIPPGADNFITKTLCPSECSQQVCRVHNYNTRLHIFVMDMYNYCSYVGNF